MNKLSNAADKDAALLAEINQLVALFNAGRHVEFESRARGLVGQHPDSGLAWKALGISLKVQSKDALGALQNAAHFLPADAEAQFNLGACLADLGRLDDAAASYRRALALRPDYPDALNNLGTALTGLGRSDEALPILRKAVAINPGFAMGYHNLGNALLNLGQSTEAAACYGEALKRKADFAEAQIGLGNALMRLGDSNGAIASFGKALEFAPGNEYAKHLLATLTGGNSERAPNEYVAKLFDGYAARFDTHLVEELQYSIPSQIVRLIMDALPPASSGLDVLDLGCGTGLVGAEIAPRARGLVGVDLSANMLDKARARNIYTRLEKAELCTMAAGEPPASYDVVTAADVFVYLGTLDAIFAEAKRILRPKGVFGFTVEALDKLPGIRDTEGQPRNSCLLPTGRFAHSSAYVRRLTLENGFRAARFEEVTVRLDAGVPIQAWLVLLENQISTS